MASTPRNWTAFSLRTLFILMTVLCIWLGWELSIVRQRQRELQAIKQARRLQFTTAEAWVANFPPGFPMPAKQASIPMQRRWLGDEPIQQFWYYNFGPQPVTEEERARLSKIFPEAEFHEVLPEPCHPGCFPAGTLVDTPQGRRLIEELRVGDTIYALTSDDQLAPSRITSIFTTKNVLLEIQTNRQPLLTTPTQPLCLHSRKIVPAKAIAPGNVLLQVNEGTLQTAEVVNVVDTQRMEQVFNVILAEGEHFIASGFVARCKPPAATKLTTTP